MESTRGSCPAPRYTRPGLPARARVAIPPAPAAGAANASDPAKKGAIEGPGAEAEIVCVHRDELASRPEVRVGRQSAPRRRGLRLAHVDAGQVQRRKGAQQDRALPSHAATDLQESPARRERQPIVHPGGEKLRLMLQALLLLRAVAVQVRGFPSRECATGSRAHTPAAWATRRDRVRGGDTRGAPRPRSPRRPCRGPDRRFSGRTRRGEGARASRARSRGVCGA